MENPESRIQNPESKIQKPESIHNLPAGRHGSQFSIKTEGLSKRFNREWIFKNLTYTFQSGNTYAITGPNGSGKSTLLQVLWGQMPQTSGAISYSSKNENIPIEEIYNQVAIATPYMDLIEEFSLLEQIEFHFRMRRIRSGLSVNELIDKLYLSQAREKHISNFSSGMKQRLKLGLAFYTESSVLFLDEPGTNLDVQAFDWYKQNLSEVTKDQLIIIASNQSTEYPENSIILNMSEFK